MVNARHPSLDATVIEESEAFEAAVHAFLQLYELPGQIDVDPLERFGPYLEPVETLNSARIQADYGQELEAAHQAVEAHWEKWQRDNRPAIRHFVAAVERRWLRTYDAPELLHAQFPERRDIVPDHITEGVMLLAGKSGLGKSWWALQLAIAVAQGGKAFGSIKVDQGDVLYLSLEDDQQAMDERLAMCLEEGEAYPQRLTIAHEAPLLSDGLSERLEAWLRTHEDSARLIIIDVLQKIRPPRRHNGDIYEQDYAIGEALKPLARRYHVAIVILHHCNKLVDPADPLDAISGSTGLIAPADIKAVFTRARGEADAKLFLTGRPVREQWVAFKFDEGIWTYLGDAEQYERSEAWRKILAFVNASTEPVGPKTVASCLGLPHNTVKKLMWVMGRQGTLKQAGYGRYLSQTENSQNSRNSENCGNSRNSALFSITSNGYMAETVQPIENTGEFQQLPRVPEAGTLQGTDNTGEIDKSSKSSESSHNSTSNGNEEPPGDDLNSPAPCSSPPQRRLKLVMNRGRWVYPPPGHWQQNGGG